MSAKEQIDAAESWLREHAGLLVMAEVARRIGIKEARLRDIVTGRNHGSGSKIRLPARCVNGVWAVRNALAGSGTPTVNF